MDAPRFLDRNTQPHIATLILVSALGPITMNTFLPALPAIGRHFETDYAVVQLAVPFYLTATAFLQLVIGSLSDRFGRRPVLITSLLLSLISTLVIIYAPTVHLFLLGRIVQATAIAGIVIGRATIRDTVDADEAASRMGYVTMAMAMGPMLAPIAGGYLSEIYGWESTFWISFIFGILVLALVWTDLGETNRTMGGRLAAQIRTYPELLASRRFWGYSLTAAFVSGSFFALVGGGPYLASEHYRMPPSNYGYYFALLALGYVAGNFVSGRHARRLGVNKLMLAGAVITVAGIAIALALDLTGLGGPLSLFGPMIVVGIGNGMTLPSANAGIVSVRPHLAGSASGLGGFIQIGGGALLSVLAAAVLGPERGALPLILVMLASSVMGVGTALYVMAVDRSLARASQEKA